MVTGVYGVTTYGNCVYGLISTPASTIKEQYSANMAAIWDFRDGTIIDLTYNGADGNPSGSLYWANTSRGNSLAFTGGSLGIGDKGDLSGNTGISISTWIYPKTNIGTQIILSRNDSGTGNPRGYELALVGDEVQFSVTTVGTGAGASVSLTTITSPISLTDKWYFITASYNSATNTMRIYVNGIEKASDALLTTGNLLDGADDLVIGNVGVNDFNGNIAELYTMDYGLSGAECNQLYTEELLEAHVTQYPKKNIKNPAGTVIITFIDNFVDYVDSLANETSADVFLSNSQWKINSGTWKIVNENGTKKAVCVVAGQLQYSVPALGTTTSIFTYEGGLPTLTKNATNLQLNAVAGEKVLYIRLVP